MRSTMQSAPLLIREILRHGAQVHPDSAVRTFEGDTTRSASFREVADRSAQLAHGLVGLGIGVGDRVGTFLWNTQEHQECYLAIPSMGAVLHTLNLRLFPQQLSYVVNHAEDKVIVVDTTVLPLLLRVLDDLTTVERFVVVGEGDASGLPADRTVRYEELLADQPTSYEWPDVDEQDAAAMCYTSGTTGEPKGVVYSHRSTYLHSLAAATGNVFGLSAQDSVLPVVPMFHANAWGLAYAAWLAGADLVMPGRFLQAEPLARLIETERPTVAGAVPTIWNDLLTHARAQGSDLSSLRMVCCGGSAVPRSLMEAFQDDFGVTIVQAWGMTETSPLAAIALPPRGTPPEQEMDWRAKTGRVTAGVELRIVDDEGQVLPWDGTSVGEIQVRGPWITGSYYGVEDPEKFSGGWLRTGDVATVDELGFVQITDRTKDVIKSGGEWISSVELENTLMGHPGVHEAAVVAVPDPRWQERPLACVVRAPGADVSAAELTEYLSDKVAGWWLPERWTFLDEVPKTSVGKFDKKVLRAQHADGALAVEELKPARS